MPEPAEIYRFHVRVRGRPAEAGAVSLGVGPSLSIGDAVLPTVEVAPQLLVQPLPTTFDEAVLRLDQLPRMFCEGDGSFVWVREESGFRSQVDGELTEAAGRLAFVELRGSCAAADFDALICAIIGQDRADVEHVLLFELIPQAAILDHATFRRHATDRNVAVESASGER